jgi:hypothetical protein
MFEKYYSQNIAIYTLEDFRTCKNGTNFFSTTTVSCQDI